MKEKKSAIVLLSAGLDSTVNLYQAEQVYDVAMALTFDYGQESALREIERSQSICQKLSVPHKVLKLPWLTDWSSSALTKGANFIPTGDTVDINSLETSKETAKAVWVSNRNGLFINVAAVYADKFLVDHIIVGFNKEEAMTFPDNSEDFLKAINQSLEYSCQHSVSAKCFTIEKNKPEIFSMGEKLGVDFSLLWPCYGGGESLCGRCESCKRYINAEKNKG